MVLKSSLTGILTQKLVCCFQIHLLTHYYFNTVSTRDLIKAECDFIYNRNWNRPGFAHTLTAWQSYSPRGVCLGSLPRQTEGQRTSSHPPGIPTPGCLWTHNGPSICCCGAKVQGRQLWSASSFFCVLPRLVTVDRLCSVFWLCLFVSFWCCVCVLRHLCESPRAITALSRHVPVQWNWPQCAGILLTC